MDKIPLLRYNFRMVQRKSDFFLHNELVKSIIYYKYYIQICIHFEIRDKYSNEEKTKDTTNCEINEFAI